MTELYQDSRSCSRPYCRWLDNAGALSRGTIYAAVLIVPAGSNVLPREKLEKIISSRHARPLRTPSVTVSRRYASVLPRHNGAFPVSVERRRPVSGALRKFAGAIGVYHTRCRLSSTSRLLEYRARRLDGNERNAQRNARQRRERNGLTHSGPEKWIFMDSRVGNEQKYR